MNNLQPNCKIRILNGKKSSLDTLKSSGVSLAPDGSYIDIEKCVSFPITYEEQASLMTTLNFTVDKLGDLLLYYFYIGQSITFYGGYYSSNKSAMRLLFNGTITRVKTSFTEAGLVVVNVECMNYGFTKLAKNYKHFVYPDENSSRKFARKDSLSVEDIVRGIAEDNNYEIGEFSLSPDAKSIRFDKDNIEYQKDMTDWKFLNNLAQDCGCNVWISYDNGKEFLNFVSLNKNFREQSEISFLFPLFGKISDIRESEIQRADDPAYDRPRILRDLLVDEDVSQADAVSRSATYFDRETGEYKEAISKIEMDKDGNTTATFYELDESRVQYVEDNYPDIADKIRDGEPTSLPWGTPDNPECASYYYKEIKTYNESQAVFDKFFFGIMVTARCNQDLDIKSQRTYAIRGILSYHSKNLESSFFLRGLKHIWDSDGCWTELDFIR